MGCVEYGARVQEDNGSAWTEGGLGLLSLGAKLASHPLQQRLYKLTKCKVQYSADLEYVVQAQNSKGFVK